MNTNVVVHLSGNVKSIHINAQLTLYFALNIAMFMCRLSSTGKRVRDGLSLHSGLYSSWRTRPSFLAGRGKFERAR